MIRIAVLSDVHGNRFALEAVLADIRAFAPDEVLNLGDTVWGGADPAGAWALLQEFLPRTVRGNTDERAAGMVENKPDTARYRDWVLGQIGQGAAETLRNLPLTLTAADGEVLAAHGSPRSAWEYLMWNAQGEDRQLASLDEVRARLDGAAARVVVVGHSHLELLNAKLGPTLVNVGAVSRQKDGDPAARWALLEKNGSLWNVTFRRVAYDVEAAARWAEAHAPNGESEARQLRTGRDG